jgi:hypothetical protein
MMNTNRYLAASLALLVSFGASAQDAASSPSRAEVKAQGQAALKAGESPVGDVENKPDTSAKSTKSRAQVKSETASAAKAGQIQNGAIGQTSHSRSTTSASSSHKTRAQVKAEGQSAAAAGQTKSGDLDTNKAPNPANSPKARAAAKAASEGQ